MKVSVITAVKNAENYIGETVRSILDQTLEEFEYIIVDDGSTDGTVDALESFSDSRLRTIYMPKSRGPSEARNIAISESVGEYIAILDGDDIAHPSRLETQLEYLDQRPHYGLVGGWARVFGAYETVRRPPLTSTALKASLLWGNPMIHSTVMIRRSALPEKPQVYKNSETNAEDYGLWLRISRRWEIANLPIELVRYRSHDGQLSELNTATAANSFLIARQRFLNSMGVGELNSRRSSPGQLFGIARKLDARGWTTRGAIYGSWLRSWFTSLKNSLLKIGTRNSVVHRLVAIGRKFKAIIR